jgi:hypothetical protein
MTVGELRHWLAECVSEREEDADLAVVVETADGEFQPLDGRARVRLVEGRRALVLELEW